MLSVNSCATICRFAYDLHTHLLSSSSTRSPRQVQLTLPWAVSRQRSPQPPFLFRQGDSSPSTTTTQTRLEGEKQFGSNKNENAFPGNTKHQPVHEWNYHNYSDLQYNTYHLSNQVESSSFSNNFKSRLLIMALTQVWNVSRPLFLLLKGGKKKDQQC